MTDKTTKSIGLCLGVAILFFPVWHPPGSVQAQLSEQQDVRMTDRPTRSIVTQTPTEPSTSDSAQGGSQEGPRNGPPDSSQTPLFPATMRSLDGTGTNLAHANWGSANTVMVRITNPQYSDGVGSPAGKDRPSARLISNSCSAQNDSIPNARGVSDLFWLWGQFIDHDIVLTPIAYPPEPFDIEVPTGDQWFDPENTGKATIAFDRSFYDVVNGVREQVNDITAFIDASNVYGSNEERALVLRTLDGTGRLQTSVGDLLPFNTNGLDNAPSSEDPSYFIAGDFRANEHIGLTAMHTLFVREHNFWAGLARQAFPGSSGDDIYLMARAIVGAELQAITYRHFLPILLGPNALTPYRGYRDDVNPGIANVFATVAFRVGHTMLSSELVRLDPNGETAAEGNIDLASAFFNPTEIVNNGIDSLLRGTAAHRAQEVDMYLVDGVRNFLFGSPGSGGFDLASLNIQRGRDHGLPGYNRLRVEVGLSPVVRFDQISSDPMVRSKLAEVYDSVEDIDAWVGGLAEDHLTGALVGETFFRVLKEQFERLRDGDPFWYRSYLPRNIADLVEAQSLSNIIRRNTGIRGELADNAFIAQRP